MYEQYNITNKFSGAIYPQSMYHNTPTSQLKNVGNKSILRVDAGVKVTGRNMCANDVNLPGQLYLRFKLCPYSHATVTNIDTSAAKALPGVVDVLTHADIPTILASSPDEYLLMSTCYHDGEEVAAVLATEEDIAEQACTLINVQYNVLPFVLQVEDALAATPPTILRGSTNLGHAPWTFTRGDINAGFAASDIVVGPTSYGTTAPLWQEDVDTADMEGDTDTVLWDGERLICWTFEKGTYGDWTNICSVLNIPLDKVVFPATYQGPTLGGTRGGHMRGNLMAGYLAMKWKRPVKSKFPYLQQLTAKGNRKTEHMTCKGGAKKDGTLQAFSISTTMDMGSLGGDSSTAVQMMEQWWNCPNMYLTGQAAATDTPPQGSIRCVQHPRPFVLVSMHWDRLAEGVGMDPTDFLIKNAFKGVGNGAVQETAATEYTSNPFAPFAGGPDYVTQLVTASAWKSKWKGWKTPTSVSGSKQTGIGFAMHMCSHGSLGSPESAYIKLDPDGTFLLNCGSNDIGQGSRTALALIAAEELGISATQIRMNRVDTSYVAQSCAPSGSTITRGSGTAVVVAARNTKQMIFDTVLKGKLLTGATQETDMEIANGNVYLKSNPATTVPITSVASSMASLLGPIQGTGASAVPGGITNRQYSACVAEVTVDTDTGEVSLDTLTHMLCPGRVIWYNGAVSQVCGGLIMGQGHAMFEGMVKDVLTGRTLNASYIDYKIPTIADLPTINVNFFENLDPYGPLGAVGISEPIITSIPPAIGNAIYNACGVRMTAQPFTPEKILAGLGKA